MQTKDFLFLIGFNSRATLENIYELQLHVQKQIEKDLIKMSKKRNKAALKRYNENLDWLNKYKIIINLFYQNIDCKNIDNICEKFNLYDTYFSK